MGRTSRRRGVRSNPRGEEHPEQASTILPGSALASCLLVGLLSTPSNAFVEGAADPTWQTNGRVNAIVEVGNVVYLGGRFTEVNDGLGTSLPREHLAAIDLTTGEPTAWDPGADGEVFALTAAADATTIYAGGLFKNAGGQSVVNLAALDATTGLSIPDWRPKVSSAVRALAVWGPRLYVGGTFGSISGTTRRGLAALTAATGKVMKKWYPGDVDRSVRALAVTDDRLIVGGTFLAIGDQARPYIAPVTHAGAKVKPWATPPLDQVLALSVLDGYAYVGSRSNEVTKHVLTTGEQLWAVGGDGDVQALAAQNGIVYIGGHFENFTGQPENKIAAVTTDGFRVEWGASANGIHGVFAMAGGSHLFIGGDFTLVSGEARRGFAAFAEGAVPPIRARRSPSPTISRRGSSTGHSTRGSSPTMSCSAMPRPAPAARSRWIRRSPSRISVRPCPTPACGRTFRSRRTKAP